MGRPVFYGQHMATVELVEKATPDINRRGSAAYSNPAYDLLADALVKASVKLSSTLQQYVTRPAGMANTTLTPTPEQCQRLLVGYKPSPCSDTIAAAGSGGVYSTPADMQRWMQGFDF